MRTLVVPCAGSRLVDNRPIFLNTHPDGEMLAIKTLQGVFPYSYDKIVFTILRSVDEKFNASRVIMAANNSRFPVEIVILDKQTAGPAETVYKTIINSNISGEFAVRDSHAFITLESEPQGNYIAGLDLTKYEKQIENLKEKSFIVLNEQGQALDIIEKHFCSDVISVGLYGFKNADDFIVAYEHLHDRNYPISKVFVSHIISYLIGYKQRLFHFSKVLSYEDWATETSWQRVQKYHALCFVDLDELCRCHAPLNNILFKSLNELSLSGISFIGITSGNSDNGMKEYMLKNGINIIDIVCNCPASKIRLIAKSEDDVNRMILDL